MSIKKEELSEVTSEISAIGTVHAALKDLDSAAQIRVLSYVSNILNVSLGGPTSKNTTEDHEDVRPASQPSTANAPSEVTLNQGDAEGINSVALRLVKRSGIALQDLEKIFSIGIDDIDLVTPKIPGTSKSDKFHNVLLLKGIAAYLGTGTAKVTHDELKETALHYSAYDSTNASKYLKSFAGDWTGSKAAGYTLSARGLTNGIAVVKSMIEKH